MSGFRASLLKFGEYELDLRLEELRRCGTRVKIQSQPLRLLALLITKANRIVTREEIARWVWGPEAEINIEQGINACVKQLRAVLVDHACEPQYVETVPRQGYRFISRVETVRATQRTREERTQSQIPDVGLPDWTHLVG